MRISAAILFVAVANFAHAAGYDLVGVKCNKRTDRLIVYFYDSDDDNYVWSNRSANEWTTDEFFGPAVDGYRGEKREITSSCVLSHGTYTVRILPDEDNPSVNGECGAVVSFLVDILRGKDSILVRHRLDSGRCNDPTSIKTTRIVVDAQSLKPRLTEVPSRVH